MKDVKTFKNPPKRYKPKKIIHSFCGDPDTIAKNTLDFGYGGVVTNVPQEDGFTSNPKNHASLSKIADALEANELPFWIYDEAGYPSGKAAGFTLREHPELEAKGLFMHKRPAFEALKAKYQLPDEADKIVWAAKYSYDKSGRFIDLSKMTAIPFDTDHVECELDAGEVLYVFAVKTVFEGSHGMHNVSSPLKNINIMNRDSVRRFIDVAYESIEKENPGMFKRCEMVFTDEPSLFVAYTEEDETWSYACAPYTDGIFEEYEKEYGESLFPSLPYIFEGGNKSISTRVKFYELVGKLVSEAYSGQLRDWCREHGTVFSGHYLGEDNITHHVHYYGNYIRVLMNSGYPGIDILNCYPEIFEFINQKAPQMAARKMGSNGMMVELCPFVNRDEFNKSPYDNMKCISALCYMHGVRRANSYFQHNDMENMKNFNDYVGRIGYLLDGLEADTDIFIYYPVEDVQSKLRPNHCSKWAGDDTTTQDELKKAVDAVEFAGFDFLFADSDDLRDALLNDLKISGHRVKNIIIPKIDVIRKSTVDSLRKLSEMGVQVYYIDSFPSYYAENGSKTEFYTFNVAPSSSIEGIIEKLRESKSEELLTQETKNKIIRAKFPCGDKMIYMLVNMDREDAIIPFASTSDGEIWDPEDGSTSIAPAGEDIVLGALKTLFVII